MEVDQFLRKYCFKFLKIVAFNLFLKYFILDAAKTAKVFIFST